MGAIPPGASVAWAPQPGPQSALLSCPVYEVLYGGARGGGKTDAVLGEWAVHSGTYKDKASGLMLRRSRTELYDTIERSRQIFGPLGGQYSESQSLWRMPGGARLKFAYLERDADADGYQGHAYTRVYIEEAGNFPDPRPIYKLFATLRSAHGVPCRVRLTANPGGPGHQWVKARYIDPYPLGYKVITDPVSNLQRVYIPARVSDNRKLIDSDPGYVDRLRSSGSPELVRAWLDGDWSVIAGAFFPEWGMHHVMPPCELPAHWLRYRSMDWGSARPFCVHWFAVSDGELPQFPRGQLILYREWYGSTGEPNVGLRMTAEEVADGILDRERGEKITFGVIDPAAFSQDGGPSIAERMSKRGVQWQRADNARVARGGAMSGWDQVRARLKDNGLRVFSTCRDLIRTLPTLQHDPRRPEDLDTEGEDHAGDCLRYGCMARPWVKDAPAHAQPRFPTHMTINELVARQARKLRGDD